MHVSLSFTWSHFHPFAGLCDTAVVQGALSRDYEIIRSHLPWRLVYY